VVFSDLSIGRFVFDNSTVNRSGLWLISAIRNSRFLNDSESRRWGEMVNIFAIPCPIIAFIRPHHNMIGLLQSPEKERNCRGFGVRQRSS
jgi:hypothetical protein